METRDANFEELLGDLDAVVWEYETDADVYSYVSTSCERMLGHPRHRWTQEPEFWISILHPDDADRAIRFYEAIEREPGHHRVEYRVITADHREVWTRDTIHVIDRGPGRSRLVRGICIDITEHRRAVDALAEAEQRYRSLVEHLPGVVYVWSNEHDEHGEGLYIGPQLEQMLGFTPAEWMADSYLWERRMHPDDFDRVWSGSDDEKDEAYEVDYRMIARDGREVWVHEESYPVAWADDGRVTVWQGVVLDVTESRRLEKERRTLLVQLVRTQEEERRRLGGDIHDDPIQKMIAVGMRLHTLRGQVHDPELDAGLSELATKVSGSVESLRSLLFELRPPALEKEGLAEAIRQYLELSTSTKGSVVTELVDRLGDEPPIEARTIAYRIAQEAVVNAGKHAGARHLRVELSSRDHGFLTRDRRRRGRDATRSGGPAGARRHGDHAGTRRVRRRVASGAECPGRRNHGRVLAPIGRGGDAAQHAGTWLRRRRGGCRCRASVVAGSSGSRLGVGEPRMSAEEYGMSNAAVPATSPAAASAPDPDQRRSALLWIEQELTARSGTFVVVLGLLLAVLAGTIDVITGPVIQVSFLYLIPIGLVTFSRGRRLGILTCLVAAGTRMVVEVWDEGVSIEVGILNSVVRLAVYVSIALLIATLRDALLQQRRLAEADADTADRLRQLNALKDTLLNAVSHDLRSPIAAIRGSVNTLSRADKLGLTSDQRDGLVEAIQVSAGKLDHITSDLLDLERLDRGVVEPDREPVDLALVIERVVAEGAFPADHPVRVEADPILVDVDRAKVERIIDNLLSNAIKHTAPGTPITVRVRYDDDGALLSVEDEGEGIPVELRDHIFEPFRQGEGAKERGGVGIGLSLVRRFARLHGGDAWVEDRPNGGSAFRVFLPGTVTPIPHLVPSPDDAAPARDRSPAQASVETA